MRLEEAKELLESEGYIVESFKDDLIAAFVTQCGEAVIGNKPIWRKYYDRIMKNPEMAQYVKDAAADGMSADEIVEYLLDWDEQLNEAKKPKIKLIFGIRKRKPGAKCKPAFATFEEADAYMDKFTYPQDFEIVNLLQHPELLEEDFTQGVGAPLGADQGIPHSMQGCAVPMMRLGEPAPYGKIQKCCTCHPMHRHRPIPFGLYLLGSNVNLLTYGKKRKRKKKKRKKK
jgi:hypothetical protein